MPYVTMSCARFARSDAAFGIAEIYDAGLGTARDETAAVEWYCKATRMGYGEADNAMYRLRALGAVGDACLLEVATAGNAVAQNQLGEKYRSERHTEEAAAWYRKAAEQGYGSSLHALADLYASGEGVPRDPVIAMMLLELSKLGGDGPPRK